MDSILNSTKKALGIHSDYTDFDVDITMHINTVFGILNQLGVGPKGGFMIEDKYSNWDEYISSINLTMVKSYMYLKVRLLFDPPSNGALMESLKQSISELEFRLLLEGGENDE